jgi:hypothetical protein
VAAGSNPGATVSAPVAAPIPFAMVGLELPAGAAVELRTSNDGTAWGAWTPAPQMEDDDGPDLATPEGAAEVTRFTEPIWVGEARYLQVSLDGATPAEVDATFIDTVGLATDARRPAGAPVAAAATSDGSTVQAAAVGRPAIVTRAQWGANEGLAKPTSSAASLTYAVIHHTAGSNAYSAAEAPAVVRGIYTYHTVGLGWSDVGYNILVDRYGRVYEGRRGSIDRAVVGAHAQGFNTGSLGVSVMGDFSTTAIPQAALDAVADVVAWKFGAHGIDPTGGVMLTSGGSNKYPAGTRIPMSTIVGHGDVGLTACPGAQYHKRLPELRQMVKNRLAGGGGGGGGGGGAFADVGGSVHAASISKLAQLGVTQGCAPGLFCPNGVVTRAQAVAMLVRATQVTGSGTPFPDVPANHPHAASIAAGVRAGYISGFADGTFRPELPVKRDQLASILAKARGLARVPGQAFNDVPWPNVHLANVNALAKAGITTGCGGGAYCPDRTASRAELATLIVRAFY